MNETDCIQMPLSTRRTTGNNPLKQLKQRQQNEIHTDMENIDDNYIILTSPRQSKQILFGSQNNLNLSNKQLSTISEDKIQNQTIQKLDLSGNNLQLYQDHFRSLQLILYLNLSHNYLVSLPDKFVIFHPLLQIIDLSYNYLTHLDKLPQQTQQLYIQYNYLHLFPNLLPKSLKILHIQGNPIQIMEYVPSLSELGLDWLKLIGWPIIIQATLLQNMQEWLQTSKHRSIKQFISYFTSDNFDYHQIDSLGRNIIHQAAINDDLGILIGMHNFHTISGLDYNLQTPLQLAIKSENPKSAKLLVKLGANLKNQNLIVLAISKNLLNTLKILLNNDLSPNESDIEGDTPLHYLMSKWTCIPNNIIYARLLLKYGACTNLLNNSGFSPLQMAIKRSQIDAVIFALDYKPLIKNYDLCYHPFDEDQKSLKHNYDCFELAIQYNCPEIIQILLQRKQYIIQMKQDCLNHYCVSKLINKRNKEIIDYYQQQHYQQQQLKEQQQFSCIFMNQSQIHSTKIKINEPNNFQMSTSSQYYFKHHESIKLKIGDQENIEMSDSSIDSKEEQKHSHNTINYSENIKITKAEMGVPKLTTVLNPVLSKHLDAKSKNYVKLKSMADQYYNEFIICEQVERQAHILSMLIKLDIQISHTHRNTREKYVKTIIKTIYLEINQLASIQEIESSIGDEQNQIQIRQFNFMRQEYDGDFDDQEEFSFQSLLIVNNIFIKGSLILIILLIHLLIIYLGIYDQISHIREGINQIIEKCYITSLI